MRVIVFSDTHGNQAIADKIIQENSQCDHFIFLGDGLHEVDILKAKYADKSIFCVAGNCDKSTAPTSAVLELYNTRIYITHGHLYNVNESITEIVNNAVKDEAVAALTMLGFSPAPAAKVVVAILTEQPDLAVEMVVKEALKRIK